MLNRIAIILLCVIFCGVACASALAQQREANDMFPQWSPHRFSIAARQRWGHEYLRDARRRLEFKVLDLCVEIEGCGH